MRSIGSLLQSYFSVVQFQITRLFFVACYIFLLGNIHHINNSNDELTTSTYYEKLIMQRQSTFELQRFPSKSKLAYCAFTSKFSFLITLLLSSLNQICYSIPWFYTPSTISAPHYAIYASISVMSALILLLIWREHHLHIPLVASGILLGIALLFLGPASFFNFNTSNSQYFLITSVISFLGGTISICSIPRMVMAIQEKYLQDVFKMRWMVCGFYLYMRGFADIMKVMASVFPLPFVCSVLGFSTLFLALLLAPHYRKENFRIQPLPN